MFCHNCGKEIAENSTFCTWCGSKQEAVASSVPVPSETPRSNLAPAPEQPVTSVPLPVETTNSPEQPEPPSQPPEPEQPQEAPSPQPEAPAQSEKLFSGAEVPLTEPEAPEKPWKYYTGAHLAICLVITGIMAAAAGVFAGLYFSVI